MKVLMLILLIVVLTIPSQSVVASQDSTQTTEVVLIDQDESPRRQDAAVADTTQTSPAQAHKPATEKQSGAAKTIGYVALGTVAVAAVVVLIGLWLLSSLPAW